MQAWRSLFNTGAVSSRWYYQALPAEHQNDLHLQQKTVDLLSAPGKQTHMENNDNNNIIIYTHIYTHNTVNFF